MSEANLRLWYARADEIDRKEAALAYPRYHKVMEALAERFKTTVERATAVFVSLSPNNDYYSNLRSAVTVLDAVHRGLSSDDIVVSTYRHCMFRALKFGLGLNDFMDETKGPKIRSFYMNIVDPLNWRWVTVDGHVHAAWCNDDTMTMKDAVIGSVRKYKAIRNAIVLLALEEGIEPNAYQAAIWFARKRELGIKFAPQGDMFYAQNDRWRTLVDVAQMLPYARKSDLAATGMGSAGRPTGMPVLPSLDFGFREDQLPGP